MITLKELMKSDKDIEKKGLTEENSEKFVEKYKNV